MAGQFKMDSIPGSLVVVGGTYELGYRYWSKWAGSVIK
ncbi:transcriptional regulator VpsR [Vibrio sp. JCM 18904]|nr:transcriptional regulator VpsR [Vibrio sp. JCM 18904]